MESNRKPRVIRPTNHIHADGAIDAGLRQFILDTYCYMMAALSVTGIVAYAAAESGLFASLVDLPLLFWTVVLSPLLVAWVASVTMDKMSPSAAHLAFWTYSALIGLSFSGLFSVYIGESIAWIFFLAAATFLGMILHGYVTGHDLTSLGCSLGMGTVGIVVVSVANILLASSPVQLAISLTGVVVIVGLTAFGSLRIKEAYERRAGGPKAGREMAILGALTLYVGLLGLPLILHQPPRDHRHNH